MNGSTVRFTEVQHSRQWWLWLFVVVFAAFTLGFFAQGIYVQLVLGKAWGDNPMSDRALVATAIAVFLFEVALVALLAVTHLRTEVREDGTYLRYFPRHLSFHRLPLTDVIQIEAITYRPILDYGGWGILSSFGSPGGTRGGAYTVFGNRGVRITYTTGHHYLIGSQQPDQLAAAIEAIRESGGGE